MKGYWSSIHFGFFLGFVFGTVISLAASAHAQIICSQFGNFTYCDPGTGQGSIQADLGHGHGVIIDQGTTTPYTIIQPHQRQTAPVFIPRSTPRAYSEPADAPSYSAPLDDWRIRDDALPPPPFPE